MARDEYSSKSTQEPTTINEDTRVTVKFLMAVVSILGPVLLSQGLLYQKMERLSDALRTTQSQLSDRWSRSMMVLYSAELELRNRTGTNPLVVPNPEDIARRVPLDYSR